MGRKSHKKPNRKSRKKTYKFKRSRVPPRRSAIMRGGQNAIFPASISNNDIDASPQSYLPYNNFSNDPGYSVIDSGNTGAFLTGTFTGGRRRSGKRLKKMRGGNGVSSVISNGVNNLTNGVGLMTSPSFNETSGVAGVISEFSNTGSSYSSAPVNMTPMA